MVNSTTGVLHWISILSISHPRADIDSTEIQCNTPRPSGGILRPSGDILHGPWSVYFPVFLSWGVILLQYAMCDVATKFFIPETLCDIEEERGGISIRPISSHISLTFI